MRKIVLLVVLLAGCSSMGYQGMSAEQIAATGKIKDSNVNCTIINSPWGRGVNLFVNVDKDVMKNGSIVVGRDCEITFQNSIPVAPVFQNPTNGPITRQPIE